MNELTLDVINKIEDDTLRIIFDVYGDVATQYKHAPPIDHIYANFKVKWLSNELDFVESNAEAWGIDLSDVTVENLIHVMHTSGFTSFKIPSYQKVYRILNHYGFTYLTSRGETKNSAVIAVW